MRLKNYIKKNYQIKIVLSKESKALGTWGAIANAKNNLSTNSFFVMNGDTVNNLNFTFAYNYKNEKNIHYMLFGEKIKNNKDFSYGNFSVSKKNIVKVLQKKNKILDLEKFLS